MPLTGLVLLLSGIRPPNKKYTWHTLAQHISRRPNHYVESFRLSSRCRHILGVVWAEVCALSLGETTLQCQKYVAAYIGFTGPYT